MKEKQSIILLLFLFQLCKGIIIKEKLFNQKLKDSKDFRKDIYIEIFILNSKYKSLLQIPSNKMTYYQIDAGTSGIYNVSEGSSVTVNKFGTITPKNETRYWYGNEWYKEPQ